MGEPGGSSHPVYKVALHSCERVVVLPLQRTEVIIINRARNVEAIGFLVSDAEALKADIRREVYSFRLRGFTFSSITVIY